MEELITRLFQKLGLGIFGVIPSGKDFAEKLNSFTDNALNFKCVLEGTNSYEFEGIDGKGKKVHISYLTNDSGAIKKMKVYSED